MSRFSYLLPVLTWITAVGVCIGAVWGLVAGADMASHGFVIPFIGQLTAKIHKSLFFIFGVVPLIVTYEVMCRFTQRRTLTSFVVTAVFLFPVFAQWGMAINRKHFRSFYAPETLIINGVLSLLFLALWVALSWRLPEWRGLSRRLTVHNGLLGGLVVVLVGLSVAKHLHLSAKPSHGPNLLIVLVDALRADHLSSYGYNRKTSPYIDRFARDSVVFTQAISQSTFTKTSIASLFTGKYPFQHSIYSKTRRNETGELTSDVLAEEEELLFEALLSAGFLTVGWIHNPHLRPAFGFSQGFVEYHLDRGRIETFNEAFLEWLDSAGRHEKFAAYLHYIDLHDPYRPKAPYDKMYGVYSDVYKDVNFGEFGAYLADVEQGKEVLSKQDVEQLIAYYDGLITYVDQEIGELFDELKDRGVYDDTLIVLTSDHGDAFMEHGFISHSRAPYDELIRFPLIVKLPHSEHGGARVDAQVQLVDVMPTILEVVGAPPSANAAGVSLLSYLKDGGSGETGGRDERFAFSEMSIEGQVITSIRSPEWKYLHVEGDGGREELYHLESDPKERKNLIDSHVEELPRFQEALGAVDAARDTRSVEQRPLDDEAIRTLKSLGYIK